MAETRPSGNPVIAAGGPVIQEVGAFDERGRIHLLARWTDRVSWLSSIPDDGVMSLVVHVEPGRLSLREWDVYGPTVTARYEQLIPDESYETREALRLIQDRYGRLIIRRDRRPYLGDAALHHLGLPLRSGAASPIYVAVFPDRIDFLAANYRNARLVAGHAALDDLP